jgi:hypothetical protein
MKDDNTKIFYAVIFITSKPQTGPTPRLCFIGQSGGFPNSIWLQVCRYNPSVEQWVTVNAGKQRGYKSTNIKNF